MTSGPARRDTATAGPVRREIVVALLLAGAGSALALYASGRAWVVIETPRPEPLRPWRDVSTGRDAAPWVAAAAVVGLAGAVALLATRRVGRVVVGAVLAVAGAAMAAGGAAGWVHEGGAAWAETSLLWPAACLLGGISVVVAGVLAAVRGRRWATMGEAYAAPGAERPARHQGAAAVWDSLDRGEDPTTR